jgi:putative endopeptidase
LTVIISDLNYFSHLNSIFNQNSINDWKIYLKWGLLNSSAGLLTEEIEYVNWEFYSKTLRGVKEQKPRYERAIASINWSIGQALGKLYVDKKFPPEAKKTAKSMIDDIIIAFKNRIENLSWMDSQTKIKAIEKLEKISVKIGYPDKWKDYSSLEILPLSNGGSYFENRMNLSIWNRQENISKLHKEVDKEEWYMSPQIVNAYYSPSNNEIVFPAGILQPPFYDFQADPAVNFGGIGAVIGHEISHAFDDSGADFDGDGNLVKWWSENDFKKFNELGDSLASQYDKIEVLPDLFINGKFTLGENIGDLGGVNAAYDGLQYYLSKNDSINLIDGFTQKQRFFISWATIWRTKMREEALRTRVMTDPHSPGMYRGYVPLQNIQAFYDAFEITEEDEMYLAPEKRVKIW